MAEVHGAIPGNYPWVNRTFAHLGDADPRWDGAASTCLIQGVTRIDPGGHIGPSYHVAYGWPEAVAAAEPVFTLFDFNVRSLDGTEFVAVSLGGQQPPVDPTANITTTVYDVGFLNWNDPDVHEGAGLVLPTEAPWYLVSPAGGLYAVNMQIGVTFP